MGSGFLGPERVHPLGIGARDYNRITAPKSIILFSAGVPADTVVQYSVPLEAEYNPKPIPPVAQ